MTQLSAHIPASLQAALEEEAARSGRSTSHVVTAALARYLGRPVHTVFQVSTSGAFVAGVYDREVSVQTILEHGDFGLGTFADLDGEMVVVDGRVYRVHGSGSANEVARDAGVPFAAVTWFKPEAEVAIAHVGSFKDLEECCDAFRRSSNIFHALRLDGHFKRVKIHAVNPPQPGTRLDAAAMAQGELSFADVDGSLIGLWSPGFTGAFSVAGYYFHFLSADRRRGGRLLDAEGDRLQLKIQPLTRFHLAIPESEAFLRADPCKHAAEELAYAE